MRMRASVSRWLPVVVLVVASVVVFRFGKCYGMSDGLVGGLMSSLIGAAAILSGVLFDRQERQADDSKSKEESHQKLKLLITAEMVNVAAGLMGAQRFVDAAISVTASAPSVPSADFLRHLSRPMPFTENLGIELLTLSKRELDVLTTLRSNLMTADASLLRDVERSGTFGYINSMRIQADVRHNMGLLAEAFIEFAPERKLAVEGNEPELASTLLRRLSNE